MYLPVDLRPLCPIFVRACKWKSAPLREVYLRNARVLHPPDWNCSLQGIWNTAVRAAFHCTAAGISWKPLGSLGKRLEGERHLSCGVVPPADPSCLTSFATSNSAAWKWSLCYGPNRLHSSGGGFVPWKVGSVNFTLSESLEAASADFPAVTSTFLCC